MARRNAPGTNVGMECSVLHQGLNSIFDGTALVNSENLERRESKFRTVRQAYSIAPLRAILWDSVVPRGQRAYIAEAVDRPYLEFASELLIGYHPCPAIL